MASSSTSSTSHSNPKSSRFSTSLKAFKFSTKDKEPKPPPLPPKDLYFIQTNKSLVSLSHDSLSIPGSPLSPHSQRLRPDMHMNQSSVSLVSSATSARSFSPADLAPPAQLQRKKSKGSGFFKFVRRSPKGASSKSPAGSEAPPSEDEGISMPWNFQHNIHVDEGLTSLPPSWTTSLAKAGFSPDEIADLHRRRATGSRSPGSQYLFTDRPDSPAYSVSNPPILTHPTPRSTSLPRQYSEASLRTSREAHSPPPLPHPPLGIVPAPGLNRSPQRQFSDQSSIHHHHPSSSFHSSSHSISNSANSHATSTSVNSFVQDAALSSSGTASPSERTQPSTPPRRTYHITNEVPLNSPPPSYTHYHIPPNGNGNNYPPDRKGPPSSDHASSVHSTPRSRANTGTSSPSATPDTTPQRHQRPRASTDTTHERTTSSTSISEFSSSQNDTPPEPITRPRADSRSKRLTTLPPRLSLHKSKDSGDLSSWGDALLSGISTASADLTPSTSTFAVAQELRLSSQRNGTGLSSSAFPAASNSTYYARAEAAAKISPLTKMEDKTKRQPPPTRPIAPLNLRKNSSEGRQLSSEDDDGDAPSSSYVEPASTARYDPAATSWDDPGALPITSSSRSDPLWNELGGMISDQYASDHSATLEAYSPTPRLSPPNRRGADSITFPREEGLLSADEEGKDRGSNRDSSRSSTSTVMGLAEPATIVRNVSIIRRAGAYVVDNTKMTGRGREADRERMRQGSARSSPPANGDARNPPSPLSSTFGSEESSASGSGSSSSTEQQTPTTDPGLDSSLMYYLDSTPSPNPSKMAFSPSPNHKLLVSTTDTFGGIKEYEEEYEDDEEEDDGYQSEEMRMTTGSSTQRPRIIISGDSPSPEPTPPVSSSGLTPLSPFQRYRGWLSEVVAPLEEFIDETVDPREFYLDLQEIAEGESGSVFAARLTDKNINRLRLPPLVKAHDDDDLANGRTTLVAIKSVAILPSGSPKLIDLERELSLMKGLWHDNVLSMDAVYVDLVEDALWIRMELMERSLADIIGLVGQGLVLQDRTIARFVSDVLQALDYLQTQRIAHRDVRSDNLLLNSTGILKLTDFSNAVQVTRESPMRSEPAGVAYWQAPEVRSPPYNALQVDVWSLGATIWEMAESEPPFAETQQFGDRWPSLTNPQLYSPAYHDFLRLCSEPPSSRPTPSELKKTPFINNACGRPVIVQLISQCMAIEQALLEGDASRESISE
ncbi:hypothetical protein DXG03_008764 [Asterophora parasitica]|uniref:Uncharacterized protein n=1 Tax=Asterophora parasitica TaxID=117018 RepID=A0A9P7KCL4_9AGAR|nr:hypothetical protein DXG03_008764 [Asterophora parasitica]